MTTKKYCFLFLFIWTIMLLMDQRVIAQNQAKDNTIIEKKINAIIARMTLAEKLGQLSQNNGDGVATGPVLKSTSFRDDIKNGHLGSILNISGVKQIRLYQDIAVNESRLKIPLLFGEDVIHGQATIFPVPLAESCSWDLAAMENAAKIAAIEASANGLNWTFAPMVDIARDPRWGRVVEGAGEDTYLGSKIAAARVKGFQWNLGGNNSIMACAKHFIGYGLPLAGKDYGPVEMSERTLMDVYLPPFKAAKDAGVATFMTAFNEINDIPATANKWLLTDLLKKEWGFKGFVVSDWNAIAQLRIQGVAANDKQAAELAINAGVDMCMVDGTYKEYGEQLLKEHKIKIDDIEESVRRILRYKFRLGLFDDPYKFLNEKREKEAMLKPEFVQASRTMATKSIVLLKNKNSLLPIKRSIKNIAVIGELANSKSDMFGPWSGYGDTSTVATLLSGIKNKVGNNSHVSYIKGCSVEGDDASEFDDAVNMASQSDVVIIAVGEKKYMSGEGSSRSSIEMPGRQAELVHQLIKTGKPVIVILMNGRPLAITDIAEKAPAILETWFLGSQAGNAIADVLFGDYNPSGKLTISFPRSTGQIPNYYNAKVSGRPGNRKAYTNSYLDLDNSPLYPFGYGLSYTTFSYTNFKLNKSILKKGETLEVTVTITNTGKFDGDEVVQLYVHDLVGSVTRPIKELKGFEKVFLKASEQKTLTFKLTEKDLAFTGLDMKFKAEPGKFDVMVGASSSDIKARSSFDLQ